MSITVPLNDLARAARSQGSELARVATEVVDSGWYIKGPRHDQFEHDLATYLAVGEVVAVGNGTDALELALRRVCTQERPVVVTAANAGGYTSCAAIAAGLRPRYCDIDPATHCLDPAVLPELLDDHVGAVVVTHLYGRVGAVGEVKAICTPLGIPVIEDCAQAIGARTPQGAAGSLGDLSTFSFYPTKNLGALGDGGAIATSDPELASRIRVLSQYGWTQKYTIGLAGGRNSRMDELQAALLSFRLPLLEPGNLRRRAIVGRYAAAAPASVRVLPANGPDHVAHLAVVVTNDAAGLAGHLAAAGIQTAVHYPIPDHRQPALGGEPAVLPATDALTGRVLSLPCFP